MTRTLLLVVYLNSRGGEEYETYVKQCAAALLDIMVAKRPQSSKNEILGEQKTGWTEGLLRRIQTMILKYI